MILGEMGVSSLLGVIGAKTLNVYFGLLVSLPRSPRLISLIFVLSNSLFLFALRARTFFPSLSKLVTPNGRCHVLSHSRFWQYISPLSLPTRFRRLEVTVIASFQKKKERGKKIRKTHCYSTKSITFLRPQDR